MLANKFDGDCFALVGAHQHGMHNHSQSGCDERKGKRGNIIYHILLWGGGGEGRGRGEGLCLGEVHPLCSLLSPSVSNLIN